MMFKNALLATYTSWRVGGPAEILCIPENLKDLISFLRNQPENLPITFLGNGSNVLVRDAGIRGAVIVLQNTLNSITVDNDILFAEAGAFLPKVSYFAAENGLEGLEFACGIPGTVGGALAMNAGAYSDEIWNHVVSVKTINRKGLVLDRQRNEFQTGYRSVKMPQDEWFISAGFQLKRGNAETIKQKIKIYLEKRKQTQPLELPNAGSVFRNPENDFAARLIESCGLKGYRIGGACISEKHANFIVNDRQASAKDIEDLMEHAEKKVDATFHVKLVREVKILGALTK